MTKHHPLTEEMVQSIWDKVGNEKSGGFTQDDLMRAAYDLAIVHVWKLWIELGETSETNTNLIVRFHSKLYDMRPQEES